MAKVVPQHQGGWRGRTRHAHGGLHCCRGPWRTLGPFHQCGSHLEGHAGLCCAPQVRGDWGWVKRHSVTGHYLTLKGLSMYKLLHTMLQSTHGDVFHVALTAVEPSCDPALLIPVASTTKQQPCRTVTWMTSCSTWLAASALPPRNGAGRPQTVIQTMSMMPTQCTRSPRGPANAARSQQWTRRHMWSPRTMRTQCPHCHLRSRPGSWP
jgi:hypothetical protein